MNIADIITRGESPKNLHMNSEWQTGPKFMELPIEEWPIRQDNYPAKLPELVETVTQATSLHTNMIYSEAISSERFSEFKKLIRVTARVMSIVEKRPYSLKAIAKPISVSTYDNATIY